MEAKNENMLGIFSWIGFDLPLQERLALIKKTGFEATTLWWEDKEAGLPKESTPGMVRDFGLYLENIHVPYENCNDFWNNRLTAREKLIKDHLIWLEDCAKYDIPIMVMHISRGSNLEIPNKYGVESLNKILQYAEELGITIAIENTRRMDYFDLVLEEYNSRNLGICYDSSHDWAFSKEKTLILEKWGKRLVCLHLSDNDTLEDRHWLPGDGLVDWDLVAANLRRNGYSGCLIMEVYPKQDEKWETPAAFLEKAFQRINWVKNKLR